MKKAIIIGIGIYTLASIYVWKKSMDMMAAIFKDSNETNNDQY